MHYLRHFNTGLINEDYALLAKSNLQSKEIEQTNTDNHKHNKTVKAKEYEQDLFSDGGTWKFITWSLIYLNSFNQIRIEFLKILFQ